MRGKCQDIGVEFLHPVWRYMPDPKDYRQTQGDQSEKGFERAFAVNSARQKKIEPDHSRILRLGCEADSEAQDASRDKSLAKKAPHGHDAKAHDYSGRIAKNNNHLAVGKQEANQDTRENWRIICPDIPYQKRGKDQTPHGERHPKQVRRPPWQHCKWKR
jgi:hypothetical protein